MSRLGLGVIGTGDRGIGYLQLKFAKFKEEGIAEVVAVADINPARSKEGQKDLNARKSFTDYRQLLDEKTVDAVFIMTPDWTHTPIVVDALAAGKHVYCEKPMATTLDDCNAIVATARGAKGLFFAGHSARYGNENRTFHRLVKAGKIGAVRMVWARRFVTGAKYWHRWHRDKEKSGGLLVHKGCHYLDQMNWNSGSRPRYVSAFGGMDVYRPRADAPRRCLECKSHCAHFLDINTPDNNFRRKRYFLDAEKHDGYIRDLCVYSPGATVFDNAVVAVEYASGVRGTYMECHFAPISDMETELGAVGEEGLLLLSKTVDNKAQLRFESTAGKTAEVIPFEAIKPSGDEAALRDFLDCVLKGRIPESGYNAGWDSAALGIAAQKSAAERKTMEIFPDKGVVRAV